MSKGLKVDPTGLGDVPKGPTGLGDGKKVCLDRFVLRHYDIASFFILLSLDYKLFFFKHFFRHFDPNSINEFVNTLIAIYYLSLLVQQISLWRFRRQNLPKTFQRESVLDLFDTKSEFRTEDRSPIPILDSSVGDVSGESVVGFGMRIVDLVNVVHHRNRCR